MAVNKFIGIGNVGKDPEIRSTQDGKMIASFSIGISESWKDKNSGERKTKTEWVNISAFGNLVSVIENYVKKGSKVYIEGSLQTREYEKNGEKRYATQVVLQGFNSTIQLLDSKDKESKPMDEHNQAKGNGYQNDTIGLVPQKSGYEEGDSSDEIPF